MHASINDELLFDVESVLPALPLSSTANQFISPSELFHFNIPKVDATLCDSDDLIKFDLKYASSQNRSTLSGLVPNCLKQLKPFLSKLDSSIHEPFYNMYYRFVYFYYFEIIKVFYFFSILNINIV